MKCKEFSAFSFSCLNIFYTVTLLASILIGRQMRESTSSLRSEQLEGCRLVLPEAVALRTRRGRGREKERLRDRVNALKRRRNLNSGLAYSYHSFICLSIHIFSSVLMCVCVCVCVYLVCTCWRFRGMVAPIVDHGDHSKTITLCTSNGR